jgi:hypothetical protein
MVVDARERVGMSERIKPDRRDQADHEDGNVGGEIRPEAQDPLLWETTLLES